MTGKSARVGFAEVIETLRRSGGHAWRAAWGEGVYVYTSKKSELFAHGSIVMVGVDGLKRWAPLLRDLVATDWEVSRR